MDLRKNFEKETKEKWDSDGVHNPSLIYVEWLENMIDKMKCCENCKFSKFSHGLYNECRKTLECLPNYKEWELL